MKYLDLVEVINDNQEYKKYGVHKGMVGMLTDAEIRDTEFFVTFSHNYFPDKEDVYIPIYVGDLKVVEWMFWGVLCCFVLLFSAIAKLFKQISLLTLFPCCDF